MADFLRASQLKLERAQRERSAALAEKARRDRAEAERGEAH